SCNLMNPKGKKFRTVHKYGRRRKAWNKSVKLPVAAEVSDDTDLPETATRSAVQCASDENETSSKHFETNITSLNGASADATVSASASNIQLRISAPAPSSDEIARRKKKRSIGKKQTAINDIFSQMDISHRGLHHESYQRLQKKYSHPAATSAATEIETESAQKVKEVYGELGGAPGNIDVMYDGTWLTRGHNSHAGVGCLIELYTGLVLDHCVLSNYCHGCSVGPKPGDS
ncbi:hypothetical protein HPB47_003510, partial [Ixodes persulcatus]